jgi:hypothetical protein
MIIRRRRYFDDPSGIENVKSIVDGCELANGGLSKRTN